MGYSCLSWEKILEKNVFSNGSKKKGAKLQKLITA
jgi:hypothetical protein